MATYAERLRQVWDELERDRMALFSQLRALSDAAYHQAPAPGKWSVGQIANHLFLSEQLSMGYVRKKMIAPEAIPPYGPGSWFGLQGIRFMFFSPFRFKAPKMIDMWGDQPVLDAAELDRQWTAVRQEMIRDVEAYASIIGNKRVYRHPRAGRMSLRHMLLFFDIHFRHHRRQVDRIIREINP
jgi:uncharacterized damage-inducible protein DinB